MKIVAISLLVVHLAAGLALAQTPADLQIEVGAYTLTDKGGEKPVGAWLGTGPLTIGKAVTGTFSIGETCDAFAISSAGELTENATTAWRIEVTPLKVAGDAVTLRLRWVRFAGLSQQLAQIPLDASKAFRVPNEDLELTLRPGESWPVDSVSVKPGAKTIEGRMCLGNSAIIRLRVDYYPSLDYDRRLVTADLWLIERLANGGEAQRGQMVSVRGVPNRPMRFYFDGIFETNAMLDIYGLLAGRPGSGGMGVSVETRYRRHDNGHWQSVRSNLQAKPEEIVEVQLPKLDKEAGPFANRQFAIRIRARQLR